jgi:hypothetical protein
VYLVDEDDGMMALDDGVDEMLRLPVSEVLAAAEKLDVEELTLLLGTEDSELGTSEKLSIIDVVEVD